MRWFLRRRYIVKPWNTATGAPLLASNELWARCWTWWGAERKADELNQRAWYHESALVFRVVEE